MLRRGQRRGRERANSSGRGDWGPLSNRRLRRAAAAGIRAQILTRRARINQSAVDQRVNRVFSATNEGRKKDGRSLARGLRDGRPARPRARTLAAFSIDDCPAPSRVPAASGRLLHMRPAPRHSCPAPSVNTRQWWGSCLSTIAQHQHNTLSATVAPRHRVQGLLPTLYVAIGNGLRSRLDLAWPTVDVGGESGHLIRTISEHRRSSPLQSRPLACSPLKLSRGPWKFQKASMATTWGESVRIEL